MMVTMRYDRVLLDVRRQCEDVAREMGTTAAAVWEHFKTSKILRDVCNDMLYSQLVAHTDAQLVQDNFPKDATFAIEPTGDMRSNCKNCGAPSEGQRRCGYCGTLGIMR
jgi:hypothetical protein